MISDFKKVHGDIYDYSKVNYINNGTKIEIICPIHGSFFQTPKHHMNGTRCPKCMGRVTTKDDIIVKFKKVHGEKYSYENVNYKNAHEKVEIICPIHGSFFQRPNGHLNGKGCPKCKILQPVVSKSETDVFNFIKLYFNDILYKHDKRYLLPLDIKQSFKKISSDESKFYYIYRDKRVCYKTKYVIFDCGFDIYKSNK